MKGMTIHIKPLSVNEAWQGKRFKTPKYNKYQNDVLTMLKPITINKAPYGIKITFGFSNVLSDIDNPLKPFLDILQKRYGINDRDIFELTVKKEVVKKGQEFINFQIKSL
jgi:Holliday junction resolvase RusA-like endonuclease